MCYTYFLQDIQDPDYDYLREVQSPRPQLINHYLSNYNGVEEPHVVTSPSGAPVSIVTGRQSVPLLAPSSTPQVPGSPNIYPDPDYHITETDALGNQFHPKSERVFFSKGPPRHLEEYFREPVAEELGRHPTSDKQTIFVEVYQPEDVVVRPPSPEIDYSFRAVSRLGNNSLFHQYFHGITCYPQTLTLTMLNKLTLKAKKTCI